MVEEQYLCMLKSDSGTSFVDQIYSFVGQKSITAGNKHYYTPGITLERLDEYFD
jgi:hypothetical protein